MSTKALLFLAIVTTAGLIACRSDSPGVRAGDWEGSTEFGDFTFTITPVGTAIEDVQYSFHCRDNGFNSSNFRMGEPSPLEGRDLRFGVYLAGQVPMAVWHGEFSRDGQTLSGELDILGGSCKAEFKITR